MSSQLISSLPDNELLSAPTSSLEGDDCTESRERVEFLGWCNHKDEVGVGVAFIEKNSGGGNTLGRSGVKEEGGGFISSLADTKLDVERDPNDPTQQSSMSLAFFSSCNSSRLGDGRRGG